MIEKLIGLTVLTTLALLAGCERGTPSALHMEPVVPVGSPFHGVHGLRFADDSTLYATSVIGQSIFRVDVATGAITPLIGPPEGMADDIAIGPDGTLVWTAIEDGIVYARSPDGRIRHLMDEQRGVNGVSFSPDGRRLFVSLVFYGDALYELDPSGARPPRLIVENMGGLNAFQVGADGMIYGPLLFAGRVVRIDPDTGEITTISDDFTGPGALKLDFAGSAYVLDEDSSLKRVELGSGRTTVVAKLPYDSDNLAIDGRGHVFVSLHEVDAIVDVDVATGGLRYVTGPSPLTSPTGFAVATESGADRLYVGDLFGGLRIVAPTTGEITPTPVDLFQPAHIAVTSDSIYAVSQVFGTVQRLDRENFAVLDEWGGFESPADVLVTPFGDLLVAETATGRLVAITGPGPEDREIVASGLAWPTGLAWAGDNAVYVSETGGGRLLRVGLGDGAVTEIAAELAQPEGIAVLGDGRIAVVEVGAKRLLGIDPATHARATLAAELPIGLGNGPSLYRAVAVSGAAIYFNSDIDNTIYRLVP